MWGKELTEGLEVLIAACDTFRAGAVEQLKTHCTRLKVPLYERGYEKDPAKDNEPLMRALSSLINVNNPNLVLFVGEALVGNDAVDQLVKFNRALHDLAPPTATTRHAIDGIVLTKFDTIDDKVGAAVSMVYASGAPIMFLGCGQTYADLKRLNVKAVVNALLK
ncbi:signal recognition particle receptor subunit alpha [Haematococcus lacustris]|uniref:Signal recognition particle receptor subunit alpha n=1 Tax=Haematococcus lacustris TaxID=44745 RepID=A0A699YRE5_HAELA|nr:signal recognition particle receptor subunit alpha [Haematococcus lacustris]